MKNTFLKTIGTMALAILMSAMFTQISVTAQVVDNEIKGDAQTQADLNKQFGNGNGNGNGNRETLEGSWDSLATFRNCLTGAALSPAFPAMNTFMQGGTMQEFGVASGLFRSPGHGVWKDEGERNFSRSFQFFRFNTDGTYSEKVIVRSQIQLTLLNNSYEATSRIEFYDTGGNLLRRGCATEAATRFQ